MTPKFKSKQTAGGRLAGLFIDGAEWVTNGHWAAKVHLVNKLSTEQIRAFVAGENWSETNKSFVAGGGTVNLPAVLKTDGLDLIDCKISALSIGGKKDRHGFTIDEDDVLRVYQWDYLTPLEGLTLKSERGKNSFVYAYDGQGLVACVGPMRLDRPATEPMLHAVNRFRATTFPS